MKRISLFAALAWLLVWASLGQAGNFVVPPQKIVGAEETIPLGEMVILSLSPIKDRPPHLQAVSVNWKVFESGKEKRVKEVGEEVIFGAGVRPCKLHAVAAVCYLYVVKDDKGVVTEVATRSAFLSTTITIGEAKPDPPQPGPGPGPTPPEPSPAPIPAEGLRVLIVYESGKAPTLPLPQQAILYSKSVRDFLNEKCVLGPDSKTREWRIYDKDVDTSGESRLWQEAMKRPRREVPWLVISNGKTGFEGPLPATADQFLELVKKYLP